MPGSRHDPSPPSWASISRVFVNYKVTRPADPACGGDGVRDHKRHSLPLTPYRVSCAVVSVDMENLTATHAPFRRETS